MQIANQELFENIEAPPITAKPKRPQETVTESVIIVIQSKGQTQRPVKFVRLADDEHDQLVDVVVAIMTVMLDKTNPGYIATNAILDKKTNRYGSQLGRMSSNGELLIGIAEKLAAPHKYVGGRIGKDLSVQQLKALNTILAAIGIDGFAIPTKEVK